jgi:hypothetical protein
MNREQTIRAVYALGGFDARKLCIDMILNSAKSRVRTDTNKALQKVLQQDRRRIAYLIASNSKDLQALVDSYMMASEENKV